MARPRVPALNMAHIRQIHWLAPVSMVTSLLAGILFAVGHDRYYHDLEGTEVSQGNYTLGTKDFETSITQQQLTLAVGTAFAFATGSCLAIAVSTAWVQCFWKSLIVRSSERPLTLENVNTAYSVIRNAFTLVSLSGWRRFSPLFILALVMWLLPISAIVAPATLVIQSVPILPAPNALHPIPDVRFDILDTVQLDLSLHYVDIPSLGSSPEISNRVWEYVGPSSAVKRVAAAVSAQGDILRLEPPASNSSWTSSFVGPALRCENLPISEAVFVQTNIAAKLNASCLLSKAYLTWYGRVPYGSPTNTTEQTITNSKKKPGITYNPLNPSNITDSSVSPWVLDGSGAAFRLAIFPRFFENGKAGTPTYEPWYPNGTQGKACDLRPNDITDNPTAPLGDLADDSTIIECQLFRSLYHVDFDYTQTSQSINASVPRITTDIPVPFYRTVAGPKNESCISLHRFSNESSCIVNQTIVEELSSLAIMDSVLDLIRGDISRTGLSRIINTRMAETVLIQTDELKGVADHIGFDGSLQATFVQYGWTKNIGTVGNNKTDKAAKSLAQTIEEMLQNVTVSLMSLPEFQSEPPKMASIVKHSYHNIYVYTAPKLWLAYGIAIACASIATAIGLYTIFSTGASYSSDFSTILRIARGATLSNEVELKDAGGKDPLPKYLQKTSIVVPDGQEGYVPADEESTQLQSDVEVRDDGSHASGDGVSAVDERRSSSEENVGDMQEEIEMQDLGTNVSRIDARSCED